MENYNLKLNEDQLNVVFWALNEYTKNNAGFNSAIEAGVIIDKLNKLI